jgi:hypothetical protein
MEGAAACDFHYRRVRPADEDEGGVADA